MIRKFANIAKIANNMISTKIVNDANFMKNVFMSFCIY